MPVFDYRCEECRITYDVYHKGKELAEDIVCPSCGSRHYKRLVSVPGAPMTQKRGGHDYSESACEGWTCGCSDGMCGLN